MFHHLSMLLVSLEEVCNLPLSTGNWCGQQDPNLLILMSFASLLSGCFNLKLQCARIFLMWFFMLTSSLQNTCPRPACSFDCLISLLYTTEWIWCKIGSCLTSFSPWIGSILILCRTFRLLHPSNVWVSLLLRVSCKNMSIEHQSCYMIYVIAFAFRLLLYALIRIIRSLPVLDNYGRKTGSSRNKST